MEAIRVALPLVSSGVSESVVLDIQRAAEAHGVPVAVLVSVCTAESGMGRDGRLCGMSRRYATREEQADGAAHSIARWRRYCGTWERAVQMFHTGDCEVRPCDLSHGHGPVPYAVEVIGHAQRLHAAMHGGRRLAAR